jgi:hypothetical protein
VKGNMKRNLETIRRRKLEVIPRISHSLSNPKRLFTTSNCRFVSARLCTNSIPPISCALKLQMILPKNALFVYTKSRGLFTSSKHFETKIAVNWQTMSLDSFEMLMSGVAFFECSSTFRVYFRPFFMSLDTTTKS